MKKSAIFLVAFSALAIVAPTAGAAKKMVFKTGNYKATGAHSFRFTVTKNACKSPENKTLRGYCLRAYGSPNVAMDCPAGDGYQPDYTGFMIMPFNVLIPNSGKLRVPSQSYFGNGEVAGTTFFYMNLGKNGRASGYVNLTEKTIRGTAGECTSGNLVFSAKR